MRNPINFSEDIPLRERNRLLELLNALDAEIVIPQEHRPLQIEVYNHRPVFCQEYRALLNTETIQECIFIEYGLYDKENIQLSLPEPYHWGDNPAPAARLFFADKGSPLRGINLVIYGKLERDRIETEKIAKTVIKELRREGFFE